MENHYHHHQEMQLLPYPNYDHHHHHHHHPPPLHPNSSSQFDPHPSLDLQLSISLTPFRQPTSDHSSCVLIKQQATSVVKEYPYNNDNHAKTDSTCPVEALKWQAAEQIRLAAMEKAYAEHVMELTRREMEVAQSEFARARALWARAMEEVERAEKIKERASTHRMDDDDDDGRAASGDHFDPTCTNQITCFSCRQKFRPN